MKWLKQILDMSLFQYHPLGDVVLLVSNEKINWLRVSPAVASFLQGVDGLTYGEIYEKMKEAKLMDAKECIPFLNQLARKNENNLNYRTKTAFFLVTKRCNLQCAMCYVNASGAKSADAEMTLEEMEEIFRQLADLSFTTITLSGGEPLLRKDIKEIIHLAGRYFRGITLNTNGTLITPEIAVFLKEANVGVMISLEGADAHVNDEIRGQGTQEKILRAIRTLKELGHTEVSVSLTVTKATRNQVVPLQELCMKLNVPVHYGLFVETGRGKCNENILTVPPEDLVQGYMGVLEGELKHRTPAYTIPDFLHSCKTFCGAVYSIVNIEPDGSVYPCPSLSDPEWKMGSLQDQSLQEILTTSSIVKKLGERVVQSVPACQSCGVRFICGGGCMANAHMRKADIFAQDPLCEFYQTVLTAFVSKWDVTKSDIENTGEVVEQLKGGQ